MKLSWRYFDIFHVVPILGTTLSSWKKNLVQYSLKKYFWFWLSVNIRQPRLQQPSQPYAVFHCQRSCSCFVSMLRKREKKGFQSSEQDVLSGPCCLLHQLLKEFLFLIRVADLQLPDAITQQWEQRENECWDRRTCAPIYYNGRDSKVIIYTPSKLQTPPLGEGKGFKHWADVTWYQTKEANPHVSALQHEFCTQGFCTTGLNHPLPGRPPWKLVWRKSPCTLASKPLKTQEQNQDYFKGFVSLECSTKPALQQIIACQKHSQIFRESAWRWKIVGKNEVTFQFKTRTAVSKSKTQPTASQTSNT